MRTGNTQNDADKPDETTINLGNGMVQMQDEIGEEYQKNRNNLETECRQTRRQHETLP